MTPTEFRNLALELPEAVASSHFGHPDFRLRGKIFATLGAPDESYAMVKLTPAQQRQLVAAEPDVFHAVKGGWGTRGATNVVLGFATADFLRSVLVMAWKNVAPKGLIKEYFVNE